MKNIFIYFYSFLLISAFFLFQTSSLKAQVGVGTTTPDASAQLDVVSPNKGILIPRIALANRPASPATGLMIYQTDNTPGFYYYNGTAWAKIALTSEVIAPTGSIIPFASGTAITMTISPGGAAETGALSGFGSSVSGITVSSGTIDLTGNSTGNNLNYAFSVPRTGTITSIAAYYSSTISPPSFPPSLTNIVAQLYSSTTPNNIFTAVPGASVILTPQIIGGAALGLATNGITTGLSIPVTPQTRLLMVYSTTSTASPFSITLSGYASGGITIN